MAYNYDLETDVGKVRLLIKDTDVSGNENTAVFSDEEIQFFIDETANEDAEAQKYLAAALALRVNATDAARLAKRKRMDVLSSDTTEIAGQLTKAAEQYERHHAMTATDSGGSGVPWGTSLLDANKFAAALLELELTGDAPETDTDLSKDWLPEV